MSKYPKNIFQVWYQGCENITKEEFILNMKNWKEMNPEWSYKCADDKFMEDACMKFSEECHKVYKQTQIMHVKIDLARYVLIYLYGGMYIDMDAYIMRPLKYSNQIKKLLEIYENKKKHVIGLSKLNLNVFESLMLSGNFESVNNAIMFSSPENPALKRFIEFIIENAKKKMKSKLGVYYEVQNSTGPTIVNRFFAKKSNLYDTEMVIFDSEIFEPCDIGKNCLINENTIAIHLFENSWLPGPMRIIRDVYYFIKRRIIEILIVIYMLYLVKKMYSNNRNG